MKAHAYNTVSPIKTIIIVEKSIIYPSLDRGTLGLKMERVKAKIIVIIGVDNTEIIGMMTILTTQKTNQLKENPMLTIHEINGVKKAAIVLKTLAEGFNNEGVKAETMTLVKCVMSAAVELEEQYYTKINQA